jgi:hypothetical protein
MREEKVILDFPEAAEKIIAANSQVKNDHHSQGSYQKQKMIAVNWSA